MVANPQPKTQMTLEEFLAMPESNALIELIHEELIQSPTPDNAHGKAVWCVVPYLYTLITSGHISFIPMDVFLDDKNVLMPDVFWTSGLDSKCKLGKDGWWHGAPDLVIEVLSPSTEKRDRSVKYDLYQQHGTREYWLLNIESLFIEVYRSENGQFTRQGLYEPGETFISAVLANHEVSVNALFGIKPGAE
jgi:Uma2 family endonuclease